MTNENRELLLKDLCGRLPYNVAIDCRGDGTRHTCYLTTDILNEIRNDRCYYEYKPFLLPLSSMTEEQRNELENSIDFPFNSRSGWTEICYMTIHGPKYNIPFWFVDFCNKYNLDYRGLILNGLANDATGLHLY